MGGGGAMRAAAKAAGIGIFNNTIRGGAENPASKIARAAVARYPPPPSIEDLSVVGSSQGSMIIEQNQPQLPVLKSSIWDVDEEYCVVVDDELSASAAATTPRLVFGPAPSFDEAKEATSELKEAIDKIYFSSPSPESVDNVLSSQGLGYVALSQSKQVGDRAQPVIDAFLLLKQDPAAQNVVTAIACDPNVWNAVLQNPALQEYVMAVSADYSGDEGQQSPRSSADSSSAENNGSSEYGLMDFVEDIKNKVLNMVRNLTDFVQNLFSGPGSKRAIGFMEANQGAGLGGSFMGLAVLVIMVILVRRS